jgi:hypothetical protein
MARRAIPGIVDRAQSRDTRLQSMSVDPQVAFSYTSNIPGGTRQGRIRGEYLCAHLKVRLWRLLQRLCSSRIPRHDLLLSAGRGAERRRERLPPSRFQSASRGRRRSGARTPSEPAPRCCSSFLSIRQELAINDQVFVRCGREDGNERVAAKTTDNLLLAQGERLLRYGKGS